jgi:MFS family permease
MLTQQDQDNAPALALAVTSSHSRTSTRVARRPVERSALLAGRRRGVCAVLAVAAWAATAAAVIAGGQFGRGAAIQITLAAAMATAALGETLLSPLWQAAVADPGRRGAVGRYSRPGAVAFAAVLLGSAAGGAALGAVLGTGWRTTLFTTVALVCATASIAAHHLGQHPPAGCHG